MQHIDNLHEATDFREILYHDNLNRFREKTNGKELLNFRETAILLGLKDTRTVKKMFPFVNGYITLSTLARSFCTFISSSSSESFSLSSFDESAL